MNNCTDNTDKIKTSTDYTGVELVELARLVCEQSDTAALRELHNNRRLFCYNSASPLLLSEFITVLCNSPWALGLAGHNYNILEKTYDLLIDRFSNIPNDDYPRGPDCRYYFRAFLDSVNGVFEGKGPDNPLRKELAAAKLLQDMVLRHFKYCLKETLRGLNPLRTRYHWHTCGGVVTVWMPVFIQAKQRKSWLERHVDGPDASSPGEKYRIQQIIDSQLGSPGISDFDCPGRYGCPAAGKSGPGSTEIEVKGLADAVADEKAGNILSMRPAIKSLGKKKLGELIRCIFHDVSFGCYQEKAIAQKFGLSRATLSRFAGSRWKVSAFERCPDLWSNLARVLASDAEFTRAARDCGVWERVMKIIEIEN
jgi:hypothetical protein